MFFGDLNDDRGNWLEAWYFLKGLVWGDGRSTCFEKAAEVWWTLGSLEKAICVLEYKDSEKYWSHHMQFISIHTFKKHPICIDACKYNIYINWCLIAVFYTNAMLTRPYQLQCEMCDRSAKFWSRWRNKQNASSRRLGKGWYTVGYFGGKVYLLRQWICAIYIHLLSRRIQICPKKRISLIIWGWDWDHQSYSREVPGFLGYDTTISKP